MRYCGNRCNGEISMILVTGAGGFIGSHLCHLLYQQGYDVVAVDRHFDTPPPSREVLGDISDAHFLNEVLQTGTFETIIHMAAVLNTASRERPEEALRVNVGGGLTLLRLAAQSKVKKFIFGSSISVYGAKPFAEYGEVSEEQPAAPNTVYGVSKLYVELVGQDYHQRGAFTFVSVRIAMVVGAGATNTATPWRSRIFEKLAAQQSTQLELPFARTERLPLIHVADVAEVIYRFLLVERPIYSLYNTPVENWIASDLGTYLHSLNANIDVKYNPGRVRGDPESIKGQRFTDEFDFRTVPLRQRLQSDYLARTKSHESREGKNHPT